jgi:cytidylate kinase
MQHTRAIAIDGPAASGKSTIAKRIAKELGYLYVDTGVMYRAVTLAAIVHAVNLDDEKAVNRLAESISIDIKPPSVDDNRQYDVILDGKDVTWDIRSPDVNANVSLVSSYAGVRKAMTARQREIGLHNSVVMVGRDIGTVVLPEADVKIYLDASVEERAWRRRREFEERGESLHYDRILRGMQERDHFDSTRELAPLYAAPDAIIIDTTDLTIDEVTAQVMELVSKI